MNPEDWSAYRERLLAAVRKTDEAELRRFYDEFFPMLYRYVLCRLEGNHQETEEVVQEVFFQAYRDVAAYDGRHPPGPWLLGIARHRILDHCRRKGRRPVVELAFSRFDEEFMRRLNDLETEELPDSALQRSELALLVELVLSQMPKSYEQVLRLRYFHEKPVKDLAQDLKTTPKAAEAQLARARMAFRDAFRIASKSLVMENEGSSL